MTTSLEDAEAARRRGRVLENRNPANHDDRIGFFPDSTIENGTAATEAACTAYDGWRLTPGPKRAEILFCAAQLIVDRKETFARDMTRETGKVLEETRGDVQEAIDMTYFIAAPVLEDHPCARVRQELIMVRDTPT